MVSLQEMAVLNQHARLGQIEENLLQEVSLTVKVYSACNRSWGAETILQLPCRVKLMVRLISINVQIARKLLQHF